VDAAAESVTVTAEVIVVTTTLLGLWHRTQRIPTCRVDDVVVTEAFASCDVIMFVQLITAARSFVAFRVRALVVRSAVL
jgi:hypothetical protein